MRRFGNLAANPAIVESPDIDAASAQWRPPIGWKQVRAGIFVPPDHVPTDYELPAPAIDVTDAEAVAAEIYTCSENLPYFATSYLWTLHVDDPAFPQWRKFPAYPHLIDALREFQRSSNMHIDKSRQMLLSWALMATFLWDILFHRDWANLAVSKRAKEVDDGGAESTHDSLLGKVRLMHDRLPEFLWAPFDVKKFVIRNPAKNSHIKGETGNAEAGRSGSYKRALLDEAAYIRHGRTVMRAVLSAAKTGTILNSTPNGKDNVFADVKFSKTSTFKKLSFHWTRHPTYAEGLYCLCGWRAKPGRGLPIDQYHAHLATCPRLAAGDAVKPRSPAYDAYSNNTPEYAVASEWDISYETSMRGRVFDTYHGFKQRYEYTDYVDPIGEDESPLDFRARYLRAMLNPNRPTIVGWDFGVNNQTAMVLGQVYDEDHFGVDWIDEYVNHDLSWDHYHAFFATCWLPIWREIGGAWDIEHYGDPAGRQRDSNLTSWAINLANALPPIYVQSDGDLGGPLEWIDFTKEVIRRDYFRVSSLCTQLIDMLEQWHFPLDRNGVPIPGKFLPVHDSNSDIGTAMLYAYRFRWNGRLYDTRHTAVPDSVLYSTPQATFDWRAMRPKF